MTALAAEMLGPDNDDPLAAQWLIRVFLALWGWPLKDPAAERALVERFLGSSWAETKGGESNRPTAQCSEFATEIRGKRR